MNKRCTAVRFLVILTIFVCLLTPGSIRAVGSGEWVPVLWQVRPCAYFGIATDTARGRVVTDRRSNFVYWYQDGTAIWDGHRWKVLFTEHLQDDLTAPGFVFHASSGKFISYGGYAQSFDYDCVQWSFDGSDWTPMPQAGVHPGMRSFHAMVYDSARDRIVLFGGYQDHNENGYVTRELKNDTWEWDGSVWHEMESLTEPPEPRWGHAMVYDEARQVTLMVGGTEDPAAEEYYGGTWSWNGIQWDLISDGGQPRVYHRMVWDPLNQKVILFGGTTRLPRPTDRSTYVWDGIDWTQIQCPGTDVKPRSGPGLAWDPVNQRMMMMGGHYHPINGDPSIYLNDMLWFDGECWQPYDLPESPSPRLNFSIAYDPIRKVTLLHGGIDYDDFSYLRDSWAWDGSTWSFAGDEPPERCDAAMAYDPINQGIILYGGHGDYGYYYHDTWLWNGAWSEINIGRQHPGNRYSHEMVYDVARNQVLLFGGVNYDIHEYMNDTWVWDGVAWTDVTPDGENPDPRYAHFMAYDPRFEQVVLFGGLAHDQSYNDTWVWDGRSWSDVTPEANNPNNGYLGLSYDEKLETILLTNIKRESRSYSWDGCNWHMLPKSIYGGVGGEGRAFDSSRGRTVAFISETWEFFQTVDLDIDLDQSLYHPDDPFDLRLTLSNELDEDRTGFLLIALDVYGSLWFWPAWQPFPDYLGYEERTIPPGSHAESILSFTWPETNCAADNLLFHAALLDSTEGLLIAYDNVIWGWR